MSLPAEPFVPSRRSAVQHRRDTMASITSLGIGSGMDINSIVTQLVALERRPLQTMQSDATRLQTQVSTFGKMQGLFSSLQTASSALTSATLWAQSKASSSDDSVVSSSQGSSAAPGNYAVTVQALASSQSLASGTVFNAATDLVGSGTLSISLGSWNDDQSEFTDKADTTAVEVSVSASDTLASLRDKINGSNAGVTASIVTDTNGVRLSLRSSATGAENGFRIQAAEGAEAGLSRLAYDPPGGAVGMDFKQAAGNARAVVNGIDVVSASNELSGVIEGLTLRLRKESATPIDIAVASDHDRINAAIKTFADAYNELTRFLSDQTKYDATSKVGGLLQGDSAVTGLQSQLRSVLNAPSGASAMYTRLSDVGLQLQRDGTLQINQGKLEDAIGHLDELKQAFAGADTANPANNGFARRYADLATEVLGVDGSLSTRTNSLQKLISKNTDSQNRLNDRVDRFQQRLVQQYTAMDANLAHMNSLSSYVTQQLAAMNKSSS
jgi:flagellar hook-associated protein 2